MANVFAVKSGNWSDTTVWNTGVLPTSADDVYSNNFSVTVDISSTVLSVRNGSATSITAGGGFILTNGITLNATNGFFPASNSINGLIVFNLITGQSASIVGNMQVTLANNARVVYFNGTGTLNCIGNWESIGPGSNSEALFVNTGTNGGIVNLTGNITVNSSVVRAIIQINKIFTFNITGNIDFLQSAGNTISGIPFIINTSFNFNVTGAIYGGRSSVISTTQQIYFNHTGLIMSRLNSANVSSNAFVSTNNSSIHLMTGPFICDVYGYMPIQVARMNYIPTIGSYFEFRDNSTNGSLAPSTPAPATRLVSPDTVVDAPIQADVRFGVTYALGSQTGTLRVPSPNSVAFGVLTDNTTGTAVLTPESVWNYATSSITDANSIGARLKNCSTVDTTGEQLEALL